MKNTLISVIVPIFNAEKYLSRCVQSILDQTYKNIEIILVDDGSIDSSGKICDEFANVDNRIEVIHKCNGGVASARNYGIKIAKGEYITFVDADDFLDSDTYEKVNEVIQSDKPDCIDFGWKYINNDDEVTYNLHLLPKNQIMDETVIKENILPPLLNLKKDEKQFIFDFSVNKIYRRSIIDNNNICFDENRKTWEDRVFLIKYIKYCKSFYSMDKCFYNYVSVPNSLSRRYDLQFFDIILQNYNRYIEWFGQEYNFDTQYVYNYWCHSIENMILRSLKEKDQRDVIRNNIKQTLSDKQVIVWYKNREPENEFEKEVSNLVIAGKIAEAVEMYEKIVEKQLKQEKWDTIKAKLYSVKRVFK